MSESGPLTKEEKAWLRKLEKTLMNPPTERIGFYTIGDCGLHAYDLHREGDINKIMDSSNSDFGATVESIGSDLGVVKSACNIHSTAG